RLRSKLESAAFYRGRRAACCTSAGCSPFDGNEVDHLVDETEKTMRFGFLRVSVFLRQGFACRVNSVPPCLATRMVAAQAGNCNAYKSVLVESVALIRAIALAHH